MNIRLFVNDYLDIYVKEDGKVYVEIGKINIDDVATSENSYANSSFVTFMKYLGIDVANLEKDICKYLSDNDLFIRIKSYEKTSKLAYNLHDISSKEELVSYDSFKRLVNEEVLQQKINTIF